MSRQEWLTTERKVLERVYPRGGYRAVIRALPRFRSPGSVYAAAKRYKLKGPTSRPIGQFRAKLTPEQRSAIMYERHKHWPGLSARKIAEKLGVHRVTVERYIAKGRQFNE